MIGGEDNMQRKYFLNSYSHFVLKHLTSICFNMKDFIVKRSKPVGANSSVS